MSLCLFVFMYVSMFVCLLLCLSVCLFLCLSVCLFLFMSVFMPNDCVNASSVNMFKNIIDRYLIRVGYT